jgi:4-amino-4-deoxy-L-arabinose transferase-like glycosyltransferase
VVILVVLLLALAIRVGTAEHYNNIVPQTDAADYDRHAVSIADGNGYPPSGKVTGGPGPSAFRPPLYPLVLAGAYVVSGTADASARWESGRLEEALIGTIVVALIALIAFQLWGRVAAVFAGGIAAIYPPFILAGSTLLTEPLFTALCLGGVAVVLRFRGGDERRRWLLVAGACAGLATLTRTNGAVAIAILALAVWTSRPRWSRRALLGPAALLASAALVILPWTIRNAIELDAFVPVSTQANFGLAGQYNHLALHNRALWLPPFTAPEYRHVFLSGIGKGEIKLAGELHDKVFDFIGEHPAHVAVAGFWNALRTLNLVDPVGLERQAASDLGEPQNLAQLSVYSFWVLALFILVAISFRLVSRMPTFMYVIPILFVVSVMFVSGITRYRTPADPFLILAAASALAALCSRLAPGATEETQ